MIAKDSVVELEFTLKNQEGEVLDSSKNKGPLTYLHGHQNLIPGLEKALDGKKQGEKLSVSIPPEEGFGVIDPTLKMEIPRTQFPAAEQIQAGMQFEGNASTGEKMIFVVTGVDTEKVHVDANHPLAGHTLFFDVEVKTVRKASDEELEHGHVHEPGGHHHH